MSLHRLILALGGTGLLQLLILSQPMTTGNKRVKP